MKSYIPLIRRDWRLLLFGAVMFFCSSAGQTFFISLFGGEIRQDLSLSHSEFGGIYSAATLLSAFILLWSGSLIDHIDLRKFTVGIIIGLALTCILMAASENKFMLFVTILGLRHMGQGLVSMSSSSTMIRYIPTDKSKANSLARIGYSTAEAILPSLIILILVSFTWRQSWLLVALFLIICIPFLLSVTLKEYSEKHKQYLADLSTTQTLSADYSKSQKQWTRKEVIRDPLFYLFVPSLSAQALLYTGFIFHQIYLIEEKAWSLPFWGSLFLLFSITTIVMSLSIGALSDKIGAIKLAPFTALAAAIGLLILSISDSPIVAVIFMFCMAISNAAQAALFAPFIAERYGNKHYGSIKSLGTFSMVLMSAISPVLMGWLIDKGVSIDNLALGFSIYAFAVVGLAYLAYRLSLRETFSGLS